mmetsp:Transcript_9825/g.19317  ORF Transcript_9825/g.19317 Transcript_9825/m.19317 type:complete len:227 (-) Transcript_9825:404-1084(-)
MMSVSKSTRRRVAIFGSSLNPPTGLCGHQSVVDHFAKLFDQVMVLPVYAHVFDSKRNSLEPFEHRVAMARLCFAPLIEAGEDVVVSTVERDLTKKLGVEQRLGTYQVLTYLRSLPENADTDFVLILGTDTFNDLCSGKWRNGPELLSTTEIAIIHREGYPMVQIDPSLNIKAMIYEMGATSEGVSSTGARDACAAGDEATMAKYLPLSVIEYIKEHKLYNFGIGAP